MRKCASPGLGMSILMANSEKLSTALPRIAYDGTVHYILLTESCLIKKSKVKCIMRNLKNFVEHF